ncbi:hemerythrin domain-containing protein [Aquabacterium humicola]|uniref:hemerythrin domain-containing protein n=1 Tax=Aquabacterium humicola TaxID=3237377 RepID=UPI0025433576|nr:hemerythrin domain-containing protein [Rubrivivax pictus]
MSFSRQTARLLDDEHRANLQLLERVERALRGDDAGLAALAAPLVRQLDHEIGRHFNFEEEALFPLMADAGDGDLATLLAEEHATLREVAAELLPLARAAAAGPLGSEDAAALRRLAAELVERLVAHIQKETMGLLPLLDDLLDDEADRRLAFEYAVDA